jgi:hypothetical protein
MSVQRLSTASCVTRVATTVARCPGSWGRKEREKERERERERDAIRPQGQVGLKKSRRRPPYVISNDSERQDQ